MNTRRCRLANALSIVIALGFALYVFGYWVQHPTLTQMQIFLRFWPYYLAAAALVIGAQLLCDWKGRKR